MYLIAIHVPIYVRGDERLLATDWKRSLELLRDSLNGAFGNIYVVAPSLDATQKTDQQLEMVDPRDGIYLCPSFPYNTRAREYWLRYRRQWEFDVSRLAVGADVVHAGFDDCYRPVSWLGFQMGIRYNKPTVFVQDTDHVGQLESSLPSLPFPRRAERFAYKTLYERAVREGVGHAALSLLKGRDLHARYGEFAANAHNFHDTSYFSHEITAAEKIEERNRSCMQRRTLRLVYCGRLEERKGVDHSITALARARQLGADVSLDIIGDGAERSKLEALTGTLGASQAVRFHGQRPYGAALLQELSDYDALLFTPRYEDTPRMIFDGYAAGLPLIGYEIPYVRERLLEDRTAITSPVNDVNELADTLCNVYRNRRELCGLAANVQTAARYHAADAWYRRRAELTIDAVARYRVRVARAK